MRSSRSDPDSPSTLNFRGSLSHPYWQRGLLRHPEQLKRLKDDPAFIQTAVEELLRYDSPVQRTARITNTEVEVDSRKIAKGSMVVAAIGAANRDPAHFSDPDRLDITRRDNRHVAFGFGIHFCLGAPLARVEGQIALGTAS